jgi:WbqC-like protein family
VGKRVAILQSNYLPWRGYFDILGAVDDFVIYDVVQFTKNDWRNRNRIKTRNGPVWLTIPVQSSGKFGQTIATTRVADPAWADRHWRSLAQAYARAPFFAQYEAAIGATYQRCRVIDELSRINLEFITLVAGLMGLTTPLHDAADLPMLGDRTGRLVSICGALGATEYLSGPSAREYLDLAQFTAAGIAVSFADYSGYQPYPQGPGPFASSVTALDLLCHTGPEAGRHLLGAALTGTPTKPQSPASVRHR